MTYDPSSGPLDGGRLVWKSRPESAAIFAPSVGSVAGLFSGIGGLELGLKRAGFETQLMCEKWAPAADTLRRRFPDVHLHEDIRDLVSLPPVDIVTAGFPCTDLSQVGKTRGIDGQESGLIREVFRLVRDTPPRWVILENVPNMLSLNGGLAIDLITSWFEDHGWHWAYRTVDSQTMGVAQRRRRIILAASRLEDPRSVLFADEVGAPHCRTATAERSTYGFYWTEGNRGVGWAADAVPTLKGGSNLGIPSPPAVWMPSRAAGSTIVTPDIRAAERLQGFPAGWTSHVSHVGQRWKLVGNAVTVNVAEWVGARLADPGEVVEVDCRPFSECSRWPAAAAAIGGHRVAWTLSERPLRRRRQSLMRVLDTHGCHPLSHKATRGFAGRLAASGLRAGGTEFRTALAAHISSMS